MDVVAPPRLRVATRSGRVRVTAHAGADLSIEAGQLVLDADGWITVDTGSNSNAIDVSCPEGTDLCVGTSSGRVEICGRMGSVSVLTSSGSVHVQQATSADIRSQSAETAIDVCSRDCRIVNESGAIRIGEAGIVDISSKSGSVTIGQTDGGSVRSVNGSVRAGISGAHALAVQAMSSSVEISVPRHVRPQTNLRSRTGDVRNDCDTGDGAAIEVRTESGDIRIVVR